jgi:predicted dehydrogenase
MEVRRTMNRIRIAIVGAGHMGRTHALACGKSESVDIACVFDIDPKRAAALGEEVGAPVFATLEEVCGHDDIDALIICTNDEHHVESATRALGAGKHVLLEKPIATNLADADRIIEAEKSSGRVLLVGHVLRYESRYAATKRVVEEGRIGEVVSVFARRLNAASGQDRLQGRVSVLSFLGVHDFDICNWLVGSSATRITCESRQGHLSSKGYDVEDQTFSLVRYENGAIACVESGWILPDTHPRRADFALEVVGTAGTINLDLMSQGMAVCDCDGYTFENFGHGVELELTHFVECVRGNVLPLVDGAAARAALELSLGAQKAANIGSTVTLPL